MSSGSARLTQRCWRCVRELPPGQLACPECQALVHAAQLDGISSEAKALEEKGDFRAAREKWITALPLLPTDAQQSAWIHAHVRELLNSALDKEVPQQQSNWAKRLGPLGPVAVLLAKSKVLLAALFKLKFLLSFFAFLGVYWSLYGFRFGVGFVLLILIHEMGHFIDIRRRGLPAEMPVFLPGLGAYRNAGGREPRRSADGRARFDRVRLPLVAYGRQSVGGPRARRSFLECFESDSHLDP